MSSRSSIPTMSFGFLKKNRNPENETIELIAKITISREKSGPPVDHWMNAVGRQPQATPKKKKEGVTISKNAKKMAIIIVICQYSKFIFLGQILKEFQIN